MPILALEHSSTEGREILPVSLFIFLKRLLIWEDNMDVNEGKLIFNFFFGFAWFPRLYVYFFDILRQHYTLHATLVVQV